MVTIRDVAQRAGVSTATVSYVINETRRVSDETRTKVLAAVEELGYRPNRIARSLVRGETHTIGLILPDNANPFFAEIARGVEDTSFARGYNVILCNSYGDLDKELRYANVLIEKQVDGILLVSAGMNTEHILLLQARRIPVGVVDRDIPDVSVDKMLTDNLNGGRLATNHLIELGHRRIACITGPSEVNASAERVTGYRQAHEKSGIPVDEALVVKGDFQCESGYQRARDLLISEDPPTGIFACNDMMAIGAIGAAVQMGLAVPVDLSVVGYDNIRLSAFTNPPLTTIIEPQYEQGVLAARRLLERISDPNLPPRREILSIALLVRQSTAPRAKRTQLYREPERSEALSQARRSRTRGVRTTLSHAALPASTVHTRNPSRPDRCGQAQGASPGAGSRGSAKYAP